MKTTAVVGVHSPWPLPLTFAGVAAFAHRSARQLWIFKTAVALLAGVAVAGFFELNWAPVINRTIQALPPTGEIRDGILTWPRTVTVPVQTTENPFFWITVDPADSVAASEGADLQVELGRAELRVRSILGYVVVPYPEGYTIAVNRTDLDPWWGAWHPAITVGCGVGTMVLLFITWAGLALVYSWPIRLISFYADRNVSLAGAWRLGSAALLPGAFFLTLAILAYSFAQIKLVQLLAAAALHLMIGWVYVLFAPFCLPLASDAIARGNPFRRERSRPSENPFKGSG